jgi:hypothetical protein
MAKQTAWQKKCAAEQAAHSKRVAPFRRLDRFKSFMSKMKLPEGFTGAFDADERYGGTVWHSFIVKGPGVEFKFGQGGDGHTRFEVEGKGWFSFDRTGVEDSFYWLPLFHGDDARGLEAGGCEAIMAEQLERIAQRREYHLSAVAVPGIPFSVAPAGIADLQARLKKQGRIDFMPSGFGTGYIVTQRATQNAKRASVELEKFLGVAPLFVSTFDAD